MNDEKTIRPLSEMQHWMQQALTGSGEDLSVEQIAERIQPSHSLRPEQRLAIYQRGYFARLLQCLEGQYKALCHALGPELFADFGREYLREFPSQSPTLSDLGARFAEFLSKNRPDAEADEKEIWIDFMIDLARFEWELYLLFDAEGAEQNGYASADAADENLKLQPAVRLFRSGFPVAQYYREVSKENDPQIPLPAESRVVLVRKDFRTGILNLTPAQYDFLSRLIEGKTFSEALAETASLFGVNEKEAARFWQLWKNEWAGWGMFMLR